MGAMLLQKGKPIFFHSETSSKEIYNHPTYDKELYALVELLKNGNII